MGAKKTDVDKTTVVHVRVDNDVLKEIDRRADQDRRTRAAYLRLMLREWLAASRRTVGA